MEETFTIFDVCPPWPPISEDKADDAVGYYRILTQGSHVKYLQYTYAWDAPSSRSGDRRGAWLSFTTVPAGDWNLGTLSRNAILDGKFELASTAKTTLPGGLDPALAFHPTRVKLEDLLAGRVDLHAPDGGAPIPEDDVQRRGKLYTAVCKVNFGVPNGVDKVMAVWDWDPKDGRQPRFETAIYGKIHDKGIAPRFLAHITEDDGSGGHGRIIGYAVEYLERKRFPTIDDLAACQAVLTMLHAAGILHMSLEHSDFFIVEEEVVNKGEGDGTIGGRPTTTVARAFLHDFGSARPEKDVSKLQAEMATVPAVLYHIVHEFVPAHFSEAVIMWPEPPDFFPRHLMSGVVSIPE